MCCAFVNGSAAAAAGGKLEITSLVVAQICRGLLVACGVDDDDDDARSYRQIACRLAAAAADRQAAAHTSSLDAPDLTQ